MMEEGKSWQPDHKGLIRLENSEKGELYCTSTHLTFSIFAIFDYIIEIGVGMFFRAPVVQKGG